MRISSNKKKKKGISPKDNSNVFFDPPPLACRSSLRTCLLFLIDTQSANTNLRENRSVIRRPCLHRNIRQRRTRFANQFRGNDLITKFGSRERRRVSVSRASHYEIDTVVMVLLVPLAGNNAPGIAGPSNLVAIYSSTMYGKGVS